MKIFCPSKNRACQLHALVESIKHFCPNLETDIHVLYTADNKFYNDGYNRFAKLNPSVKMEYEACFESDFSYYLKDNATANIMLLTDDCVFYRNYAGENRDIENLLDSKTWCFSFRLGLNTTTQWYRTGQQQTSLDVLGYEYFGEDYSDSRKQSYIKWNWKIRPHFENYGYLMSWDGVIYKGADLLHLSNQFSYYNPRTFEDRATKRPEIRNNISKKYMIAPEISCLFVNTINAVQEEGVPFGEKYTCSVEELNQRYLDGEVIDISAFEGLELSGSHDEIPLTFRKI